MAQKTSPHQKRSFPWKPVLAVLLVAVVGIAAYLFLPITPDMSYLAKANQGYNVSILRDTWGVPHIFGKTDADAAFGLAYAHSEDDFLTIQQTLVAARGLLASVYGKDSAANDYMVGLLRIWDQVNAHYETQLAPDTRAVLEAYAAGLNYYASKHPKEVLTPELFPVTGKDIAAASVEKSPLFFDLDKTLSALFSDTNQIELSPKPAIKPVSFGWFDTGFGSNTFAIGPSRTSDGSTFLAVNSHQPWEGPVTWYEAHVHSEQGWDTVGALFPATPAIVHGHNRDLGWAFTVNYADLTDIYVLELNPQNQNQYRFDGQWRELEVRSLPIKVRLLGRFTWTVKQETLWSVYGPVVRRPQGTFALHYAGYGRVDIFQQLYRMNKATNFKEWQEAMRSGGLPTFNVGYADKDGNIYYLFNAMLPIRKEGYDWSKYLPGDTSDTLWTQYLPFDKLPQVLNPPSGFIQNANSSPFETTIGEGNPDPAKYSPTFGIQSFMTNRAYRALEQFGVDPSITWDEFVAYKFDQTYSTRSDVGKLQEMLRSAPDPSNPDVLAALNLVRNWDLRTNGESKAAALMEYTLYDLQANKQPIKLGALTQSKVELPALMDSFTRTVKFLKDKFGKYELPWSDANRLMRGTVNLGLGGGPDVLNAVYGKIQPDGRLKGYQGDSYVMLVRWDKEGKVQAFSIHQYGSNTMHADSPHYADQSPLFVQRQLKPVWYDEAEIRAHLEREYEP